MERACAYGYMAVIYYVQSYAYMGKTRSLKCSVCSFMLFACHSSSFSGFLQSLKLRYIASKLVKVTRLIAKADYNLNIAPPTKRQNEDAMND